MTEPEFLDLEPRERDAVVAERVCGLDVRGQALVWTDEVGCQQIELSGYGDSTDPEWEERHTRYVYLAKEPVTDPKYLTGTGYIRLCHADLTAEERAFWEDDRRRIEARCRAEIEAWGTLEFTLEPVPDLTTTWEGMRLVVEAMREEDLHVLMSAYTPSARPGTFSAIIMDNVEGVTGFIYAETLPLAVAIAALKAKGVIEA